MSLLGTPDTQQQQQHQPQQHNVPPNGGNGSGAWRYVFWPVPGPSGWHKVECTSTGTAFRMLVPDLPWALSLLRQCTVLILGVGARGGSTGTRTTHMRVCPPPPISSSFYVVNSGTGPCWYNIPQGRQALYVHVRCLFVPRTYCSHVE